jgi:hypothetical protein
LEADVLSQPFEAVRILRRDLEVFSVRLRHLLPLLCFAGVLSASTATDTKAYLSIRQDPDLYSGDGSATLKDFPDRAGAVEAARSRAKAALAESVKVEIKSAVSETLKDTDGKSSQAIESKTQSESKVELQNVRFLVLDDFPQAGQLTVLASLSKEDYRRQLAGQAVPLYRAKYGLRLAMISSTFVDLQKLYLAQDKAARQGSYALSGGQSYRGGAEPAIDRAIGYGLQFDWLGWVAELDYTGVPGLNFYQYDPASGTYKSITDADFEAFGGEIGYDYVPWSWRVQPFVPLRLRAEGINWGPYSAISYAAAIGLGLRYWPTDSVSFDFSGRWVQGLGQVTAHQDNGQSINFGPDLGTSFSTSRAQWQAGISWSGF